MQPTALRSQRRREEKVKRMTGQSYYGFRSIAGEQRRKWIQDVPKSERKIGPACTSDVCAKGNSKSCSELTEEKRRDIFALFWRMNWKEKKTFVKGLVDSVPPKRRRLLHKGGTSRKGDSKVYHLTVGGIRMPVCRLMFLNTLGVKEAMVRCWLLDRSAPKAPKTPVKSLNVNSYIDSLQKFPPKCDICRSTDKIEYINVDNVKNVYQLYNKYAKDMRAGNIVPASRKTFSKVFAARDIRIFKPKNDSDVCDLVMDHNSDALRMPCLDRNVGDFDMNCYYGQW